MRNLSVAFAVSLAVCLFSMYVNYQAYQEGNYLQWSYRQHGGEITIEFAPGWRAVHIYGMTPDQKDSHSLTFSPVTLLIFLLALTLVGCAILSRLSVGEPVKDFFLLLAGYAVLFFGYGLLTGLWEDYFP